MRTPSDIGRRTFVGSAVGWSAALMAGRATAQSSAQTAAQASKDTRVAKVTATAVSVPCEYRAGTVVRKVTMSGVVAEVETEGGLTGHGFSSITNDLIVQSAIREEIAPYLKGKDALAREAISEDLFWKLTPRGQTGHAVHAISAIDCALWDIAGKKYGEPVYKLLGGARGEVKVYTTCGMNFLSREELAQVVKEMRRSGQRRIKMVVAAGADTLAPGKKTVEDILDEDAERVRIMREAAGADAELFIDANQALNVYQARYLAKKIAPYNIGFFEEPLRANDTHRLADFRREAPMPIAAGQNEGHLSRWRDMVEASAVDILQFNVCIGGGFTAGLKIAGLAQAFGVPIDNAGGYSNFNMHMHAGVANGGMSEWHLNAVGMGRVLYKGLPELTDGNRLVLPDKPGVGFELNHDAVREFAMKGQ